MGRRDRARSDHLGALTNFCSTDWGTGKAGTTFQRQTRCPGFETNMPPVQLA